MTREEAEKELLAQYRDIGELSWQAIATTERKLRRTLERELEESKETNTQLRKFVITTRDGGTLTQGAFNACMAELDRLRKALHEVRAIAVSIKPDISELHRDAIDLQTENARLRDAVRWRDVKKELPPIGQIVIGRTEGGMIYIVQRGVSAWWDEDDQPSFAPDYWLPIPEHTTEKETADAPRA